MNPLARFGITVSSIALALGTVSAAGAVTSAEVEQSYPPRDVTINLVSVNGSGCTKSNTQLALSNDKKVVTTSFSGYTAKTGPGVPVSHARKACQVSLQLNVPNGYTYAVAKADYRGYAKIDGGAQGQQSASYYYQGDSSTMQAFSPFHGGYDGDFTFTDEKDLEDYVWAPCNVKRNLNIKTDLRLDKGSSKGQSYMSMDSIDVSVATLLNIAYKKC